MNYRMITISKLLKMILPFYIFFIFSIQLMAQEIFIDQFFKDLDLKIQIVLSEPIVSSNSDDIKRSAEPFVDLKFGNLTELQFEKLMEYYRSSSFIKYDSQRVYYLTDFLTPQMQALHGKDFNSELTKKEIPHFDYYLHGEIQSSGTREKQTILSVAQCWGTAWNNLFLLQNKSNKLRPFDILFLGIDQVFEYLLNDTYSKVIDSTTEPYRFGDLISIIAEMPDHTKVPAHFSIYIGFGLVFEKEDNSLGRPYRIIPLKKSIAEFIRTEIDSSNIGVYSLKGAKVLVESRRFIDVPNIKPLPQISRVSNLRDAEARKIYGNLVKRISLIMEEGFNGVEKPQPSFNTQIHFQINNDGRGEVVPSDRKYFTDAYLFRPQCKNLFLH